MPVVEGMMMASDLATIRPSGRVLTGTLTTPRGDGAAGRYVVLLLHGTRARVAAVAVVLLLLCDEEQVKIACIPVMAVLCSVVARAQLTRRCVGLMSHKDHTFSPALATRLTCALGVSTYRFNFRGAALSDAEPDYRPRICGFDAEADDARCAARMLAARGLRVCAVVGHSRGATTALVLFGSGGGPELDGAALVAVAPRFRVPGVLDKFTPEQLAEAEAAGSFEWRLKPDAPCVVVTREDIRELREFDMAACVGRIPRGVPMLIVHGSADTTIPVEDSSLCVAAREASGGVAQLSIVSQANHNFQKSKHTEKLICLIVEFVGERLRSLEAAVAAADGARTPDAGDAAVTSTTGGSVAGAAASSS